MELALLIGANPQRCSSCPTVRLVRGTWLIESTGLKDSVLDLSLDGLSVGPRIEITNAVGIAQIQFVRRGNEESITVIARKVA